MNMNVMVAMIVLALANVNVMAASSSASGSDSAQTEIAHKDSRTGIVFPLKLAGLDFVTIKHYSRPELGYSLRYEAGLDAKLDIFIYDNGYARIPDGHQNKLVLAEVKNMRKAIKRLEAREQYNNVHVWKHYVVPVDGDIKFQWDRIRYDQLKHTIGTRSRQSERLVTAFSNAFIKVFYTGKSKPGRSRRDRTDAQKDKITLLLNELIAMMETARKGSLPAKTGAVELAPSAVTVETSPIKDEPQGNDDRPAKVVEHKPEDQYTTRELQVKQTDPSPVHRGWQE